MRLHPTQELLQLSDGGWECKRCGTQFGLLTDTWLPGTRFSLPEVYELLFWFELELTDHVIAARVEVPYHPVHRFFPNLRRAIHDFEESSIRLLNGAVEVDDTYFGPSFENRRVGRRTELRKAGKSSLAGAQGSSRGRSWTSEPSDGLVYVDVAEDAGVESLQSTLVSPTV